MNLTAGGRQRICVPDNYQKLVQQPLSTIHIPLLSPLHMFDKFSTRPSTILLKCDFLLIPSSTHRYDLPNMTGPTYVTIGVDIKDIPKVKDT